MHSRSTYNYHLPQFNADDKPTWLGDINGAFLAIDGAMHENAQNASEAKETSIGALAALNEALERAQTADAKATEALSTANSASATATAAADAAGAAMASATATATSFAKARKNAIWTNSNTGASQTPATATVSNYSATNKVFTLEFIDSVSGAKKIASVVISGEGTARASDVDFDLTTGDTIKAWRDIQFTNTGADLSISIGACNVLTNDGSVVTPTVDNSKVILATIYAEELPIT